MKRILILLLMIVLLNQILEAKPEVTIGTYSTEITSDFGPRKVGSSCDFHKAIDLRGEEETAFPLIESGKLSEMGFVKVKDKEIFYVTVEGNKKFRYLHMFSNANLPITSGNFTLCKDDQNNYAIIKWTDGFIGSRVDYIISPAAGRTVTFTVWDATGSTNVVRTQNIINPIDHPYIGPIGKSGTTYPHMHIDMGYNVNKNPLYYITHNREEDFKIGLWDKNNIERKDGWIVRKDDANSYYLKITLTSVDTLNLDEILIYIDSIDDNNLLWKFSYGGKPKEDGTENFPIHTDVEKGACSDGITDGVYSVDKDNNGESEIGYERFIFSKWEESLEVKENLRVSKLNSGKHELIIKARNVMGENKGEKRIKFNIVPSDYALYHSDTILPTPGPTGTPVAGTQYTNVVVKDLKQEPTEEAEAEATATEIPSPTPIPEITEVPVKDYLKGVLYGLVGEANFSDGKYI